RDGGHVVLAAQRDHRHIRQVFDDDLADLWHGSPRAGETIVRRPGDAPAPNPVRGERIDPFQSWAELEAVTAVASVPRSIATRSVSPSTDALRAINRPTIPTSKSVPERVSVTPRTPRPFFQVIPAPPSGSGDHRTSRQLSPGGSSAFPGGRVRRTGSRRIRPREGECARAGRTPRARRDDVRMRERDVCVDPGSRLDAGCDSP